MEDEYTNFTGSAEPFHCNSAWHFLHCSHSFPMTKRLINIPEDAARRVHRRLDIVMACAAVVAVGSLVAEYGFYVSDTVAYILRRLDLVVVGIFIVHRCMKALLDDRPLRYVRRHAVEFVLIGFVVISFLLITNLLEGELIGSLMEKFAIQNVTRIYVAFAQLYILLSVGVTAVRYSHRIASFRLQPSLTLMLSFAAVIFAGTLLLLLPRATTLGDITIIDALFTATSAACVTGLIVVDTATYFTTFGQVVILLLMQVGGLGIMTFTTFFALFLTGGLGIKERLLMRDFLNEENIGTVGSTLWKILLMVFSLEGVGAVMLYYSWGEGVVAEGIDRVYYSIFHAVSAFCNAGFSLFSDGLADQRVSPNPALLFTIAALITLGGLGYTVVNNTGRYIRWRLKRNRTSVERLSVHTKLVLTTTTLLLIAGWIGFLLMEYNGVLEGMTFPGKLMHSLFQSVTARTAGFHTVGIGSILTITSLMFVVLMFIGASPGSTGGGIKTTTFAVGLLAIHSVATGKSRVEMFRREISSASILRAYVSIMLSIAVVALAIFGLSLSENAPLLDIMFETVSAFATVGLTFGLTPSLSDPGKLIIIAVMFIGRIGPLTLAFALSPRRDDGTYDYPKENVIIV